MFVCSNCVEVDLNLTELGNTVWSMSVSHGACECCETVTECGEVSTQVDAYWDDDAEATALEIDRKCAMDAEISGDEWQPQ